MAIGSNGAMAIRLIMILACCRDFVVAQRRLVVGIQRIHGHAFVVIPAEAS